MPPYKDRSLTNNFTSDQLDWARKCVDLTNLNVPYDNTNNYYKYFDELVYLPEKLSIINFLKLRDTKNLKILDIGTGVGHLLVLSKNLGHSVVGTETKDSINFLSNIYSFYELDIRELTIEKQQSFYLDDKFDLITICRSVFDYNEKLENTWTAQDWRFLKDNIFNYLNNNGRFFIKTNIKHARFPTAIKEIENAFGERISGWNSISYLFTKL